VVSAEGLGASRPSPSDGDALPGVARSSEYPLTRAFERTTGLEPATLTLAMKPWEGSLRARLALW
jgi:hypothetical protein